MDKKPKIAVLTGAGISAESGLSTFRDSDGLWEKYPVYDVATPEAWAKNPALVLEFYNQRRRKVAEAKPNAAHHALVELESAYDVTIITQNVDDLHERAGSSQVIHVHGLITQARSTKDPNLIFDIGYNNIGLDDRCPLGSPLRPHIVWFGESVQHFDEGAGYVETADKVMVIGTSLTVYPAAGLADLALPEAEKVLVTLESDFIPTGFIHYPQKATEIVPSIVKDWIAGIKA